MGTQKSGTRQHIVISMFARRPEVGFAHKEKLSYEQRCYESTRVREKYSDRFPVIVERDGNSDVPAVDKCKYLIPHDMTMGQLVYVLRKRIAVPAEQAIFMFVGNTLPPATALVSNVYLKHKDEDGFLYIRYSGENAFGGL